METTAASINELLIGSRVDHINYVLGRFGWQLKEIVQPGKRGGIEALVDYCRTFLDSSGASTEVAARYKLQPNSYVCVPVTDEARLRSSPSVELPDGRSLSLCAMTFLPPYGEKVRLLAGAGFPNAIDYAVLSMALEKKFSTSPQPGTVP